MPKSGRPVGSDVRDHIAEILFFIGKAHAYKIAKIYDEIYRKVTMRVIYYHLRKGQGLGEFEIKEIKDEQGDFSWGDRAQKIYYCLGPKAKPSGDIRVKEYIDKHPRVISSKTP